MKAIYILATEEAEPVALSTLQRTFEAEGARFESLDGEWGFAAVTDEARVRVEVRFEVRQAPLGWTPDLITGSPTCHRALRSAKGFYRIAIEPGRPQGPVAVFEALWCARSIMEHVPAVLLDVTAFTLHDAEDVGEITELEFDIRDHVNLHAVEVAEGTTSLWVHSHGMEKFGARDVEILHLAEADLPAAESFLHKLCFDLAFDQGPPARQPLETGEGEAFMLLPSEEARGNLLGVPPDTFEGHEIYYLTVVSPQGRHNVAELLRPHRVHFQAEPAERTEELRRVAQARLSTFKARFGRKGLMEPLTFLVRAPFETHPDDEAVVEHLWLEVLRWDDDKLVGKLVDGAAHTTEWRKGAQVEVGEQDVNALALSREGREVDDDEVEKILGAERPM